MKMTVDILLVCYNQQLFVRQALESIFIQRIDATVRLIIADDGSSDDTLSIIKELAGRSPFEIVYLPDDGNHGISQNYYRAFEVCGGDYIAILEGDDYWSSPYHLKQHTDLLDAHRECSMSMNSYVVKYEETGELKPAVWIFSDAQHYVTVREQIAGGNQLGNLSSCVLRTSCVKKLPRELFDLPVADWMLGVMLSQQGLLAILKESTSVYRVNAHSQWASMTSAKQLDRMLKLADMYDSFQDGKYHTYWESFKKQLHHERNLSKKEWLPPFVIALWRSCIPPALKRILRKRDK